MKCLSLLRLIMGKCWCKPPGGNSSHTLAAGNVQPGSQCWKGSSGVIQSILLPFTVFIRPVSFLGNAHPTSSCSAGRCTVLQAPRTSWASPAEHFSPCVTSTFSAAVWPLLSTWGMDSCFPLCSSFYLLEDCLSSACQSKNRPILLSLPRISGHATWPLLYPLGCLVVFQGLNSLAEVLDSPCHHLQHAFLSSRGLLLVQRSQLHCRSLGCWRTPWWTHPGNIWLSWASTLVLPLYPPISCFLPSCPSALSQTISLAS